MKKKQQKTAEMSEAIGAIKELENATGVKVQTGLRAGGGTKKGGGGQEQPLYGVPVSTI